MLKNLQRGPCNGPPLRAPLAGVFVASLCGSQIKAGFRDECLASGSKLLDSASAARAGLEADCVRLQRWEGKAAQRSVEHIHQFAVLRACIRLAAVAWDSIREHEMWTEDTVCHDEYCVL